MRLKHKISISTLAIFLFLSSTDFLFAQTPGLTLLNDYPTKDVEDIIGQFTPQNSTKPKSYIPVCLLETNNEPIEIFRIKSEQKDHRDSLMIRHGFSENYDLLQVLPNSKKRLTEVTRTKRGYIVTLATNSDSTALITVFDKNLVQRSADQIPLVVNGLVWYHLFPDFDGNILLASSLPKEVSEVKKDNNSLEGEIVPIEIITFSQSLEVVSRDTIAIPKRGRLLKILPLANGELILGGRIKNLTELTLARYSRSNKKLTYQSGFKGLGLQDMEHAPSNKSINILATEYSPEKGFQVYVIKTNYAGEVISKNEIDVAEQNPLWCKLKTDKKGNTLICFSVWNVQNREDFQEYLAVLRLGKTGTVEKLEKLTSSQLSLPWSLSMVHLKNDKWVIYGMTAKDRYSQATGFRWIGSR